MNPPSYVWYACYGSNLCRDRFMIYLAGGQAPGSTRVYPGTRDQTPPTDDRPFTIPRELYFAQASPTWNGGGVAFVTEEPVDGAVTYARLYRITSKQFAGVFAEENGGRPNAGIDWGAVLANPATPVLRERWYGTILNLGEVDSDPVLTFTWDAPRTSIPYNIPAPAYLQRIASGLSICHGLPHKAIVDYLAARPGLRDTHTRDDVVRMLDGG